MRSAEDQVCLDESAKGGQMEEISEQSVGRDETQSLYIRLDQ